MTTEQKAKHTPGPWRYFNTTEGHIAPAEPGTPLGYMVVNEHEVVALGIEYEADARLIAAAPELLEALQLAVRMLDRGDGCFDYTGPLEWQDRIKAAITKAVGS